MSSESYDIALIGGRAIDPPSGLDAVRHVGIVGGRIAVVTEERIKAVREVDVAGLVVAPGFIDLHSHAQTLAGARLQAMDGVTTALELEGGALPVADAYDRTVREGRPINFGFSVGWAHARLSVLAGLERPSTDERTPIEFFEDAQADPRWNAPATPSEVAAVLRALGAGLVEGGLGIGALLGYMPDTDPSEFLEVARLAAGHDVPVFTHSRRISLTKPGSSIDGIREIVAAAESTGAHVHVCHLNSTSLRLIDQIRDEVIAAQGRGVYLSTEAYPYGAGSTGIGADFFAPARFDRLGVPTTAIRSVATGERVADLARLAHLREDYPGALVLFEYLDTARPDELRLLLQSVTMPAGIIASDAMPLTLPRGRRVIDDWPLPAEVRAHPRSAGTFARTLRWLVRELRVLDLPEAIQRMSSGPAALLEQSVPAMRRKGRLQAGADADIVVFDPDTVADTASFEALTPSTGFRHVLVNGCFIVVDGRLDPLSNPGAPIRR